LAGSVAIVDAPAARIGFARVVGIDIAHRHAGQSRLLSDELAALAERPVVQASSLATAGHKPGPDMGQIQPNRTPGALRFIIWLSGKAAKGALGIPIQLVSIGDLGDAAHDDLRRQTDHVAHNDVLQMFSPCVKQEAALPPGPEYRGFRRVEHR
jgi:hypothetical protein